MKRLFVMLMSLGFILSAVNLSAQDGRKYVFTANGKSKISFVIDLARAAASKKGKTLIFENAITDFSLPADFSDGGMNRRLLGGAEAVNLVEITGTALIFRLTVKGTGGGEGNLGGSIVVIFNLDKSIEGPKNSVLSRAQGKLAHSTTAFSSEKTYVLEGLAKVGAAAKKYTDLLSNRDQGTLFQGLALFDPTKPSTLKDCYFEFGITEETYAWTLGPAR